MTKVQCEECGKEILKKDAQIFNEKRLCAECAKKQNDKNSFSAKLRDILENSNIIKYDIPKIVRQITTVTKTDEYDEEIVLDAVRDLFNPENPKVAYTPQLNIYNVIEKNYYIYYNQKQEQNKLNAYWEKLIEDGQDVIKQAVSPDYETVYISQDIIERATARKNKKMYDQRFGKQEDIEAYLKMRMEEEEQFNGY